MTFMTTGTERVVSEGVVIIGVGRADLDKVLHALPYAEIVQKILTLFDYGQNLTEGKVYILLDRGGRWTLMLNNWSEISKLHATIRDAANVRIMSRDEWVATCFTNLEYPPEA